MGNHKFVMEFPGSKGHGYIRYAAFHDHTKANINSKKKKAMNKPAINYRIAEDGRFTDILPHVAARVILLFREHESKYEISEPQAIEIMETLLIKSFKFNEMHRTYIPKPNKPGELRPITIPHVLDVIVMDSMSEVFNDLLRHTFLTSSHGFRKKRSVETLFMDVKDWGPVDRFIGADIVKCYDNLTHNKLLAAVQSCIDDQGVMDIIKSFLQADIFDRNRINYNYSIESKGRWRGSSVRYLTLLA